MTLTSSIQFARKALRQRKMAHRHYLDPLAPFPRRSPNRPTYVLHAKCRITVREVGIVHHADFSSYCLRPPQEGRILMTSHVPMPPLSFPRKHHSLFLTAVNSTFYVQTPAGRAESQV